MIDNYTTAREWVNLMMDRKKGTEHTMKKTITIEATVCDVCCIVDSIATYQCMKCGKDHCYECSKTHGVKYNCGVHHSGSGDGYYCKDCDEKLNWAVKGLSQDSIDPLYYAYLRIERLRKEEKDWYEDFRVRAGGAENTLQLYYEQSKKEQEGNV